MRISSHWLVVANSGIPDSRSLTALKASPFFLVFLARGLESRAVSKQPMLHTGLLSIESVNLSDGVNS